MKQVHVAVWISAL